jgi:tight adherence protein C
MRPVRLVDRVAPYLGDARPRSRLLNPSHATDVPFAVVHGLFGPALRDLVRVIDRVVGGSSSVRRRLAGLGCGVDVDAFRIEQAVWGSIGMGVGACLLCVAGLARSGIDPVLVGGAAIAGAVAGVLSRDYWLTRQLAARERAMVAELPVVADLIALSVVAGEGPADALARVSVLTGGELCRDLDSILRRARSGVALTRALGDLAEVTTSEPFARFLSGISIAIERGTPLADVLRSQAMDARDVAKRALLDAGGKKEISMMLPVVFMILPVTVLFALYPGLLTLTAIAR